MRFYNLETKTKTGFRRVPSAAKQFAEKVKGGTSGAEAPDDRASFMSELKLRPPKKTDFFRKLLKPP
jgi:hypothetical protein